VENAIIQNGKEMIESMSRLLVDAPEAVQVSTISSDSTVIFSLRVDRNDIGKVIGKHGKNIAALRHLIYAYSSKHNQRAMLELVEV
jgi:predicted RNA-binding protein YlqC (UPF0109 family)